jgi:hypothetical protein
MLSKDAKMWENFFKKSASQKKKERKANKDAFKAMIMRVLQAGCSVPDWYSIWEIHQNCCSWTQRKCRCDVTREVLKELGFTQRKRRRNSLCVYINLENPQQKAPEITKPPRIQPSERIQNFAKDCIEPKPGSTISKTEMYSAFIKYCHKTHSPTVGQNSLTWNLKFRIQLKDVRKIINGKRVGFWRNVALKQPPDQNTK